MKTEELFQKAMREIRENGQAAVNASHQEAVKYRKIYNMDEGGHPVKVQEINPETGEVIKKKRGRKPKNSIENKDSIEKKDKNVIIFTKNINTLELKIIAFDFMMKKIYGDAYTGNLLNIDKESILVIKEISKSTKKNPNGSFRIILKTDKQKGIFYEFKNKFHMSSIINYKHYMKDSK